MSYLFLSLLTTLWFHSQGLGNVIQLDMVNSSAAYIFSWNNESDQLAISRIPKEAREHGFEDVWTNAVKRMNCIVPSGLTKELMVALYAYTADYPKHNPFYR
ncbi:hypothetical protein chiPu_0018405 [Chiloscyllium punctatum]|uniref:Uncharacterized protein n=1 Tax=Chiloscyllium punctatum TaxID=137246 RepID=A0A401RN03_CHIPU|nr:hypothetical protein [Chiloscyllium punctatum]